MNIYIFVLYLLVSVKSKEAIMAKKRKAAKKKAAPKRRKAAKKKAAPKKRKASRKRR